MSDRRVALAWLLGLPLVIAACATPVPPAPDGVPASAATVTQWAGRFAVTLSEPGVELREERASGRFRLESVAGETRLELFSPLGQTVATAALTPARASLTTAEGQVHEAASAEDLTEQVLGWRVPIGALPQWLRGELQAPTEFESGRPTAGHEQGWSVRLENWRATGPRRLTLDWPTPADESRRRLNLKLIVDEAS